VFGKDETMISDFSPVIESRRKLMLSLLTFAYSLFLSAPIAQASVLDLVCVPTDPGVYEVRTRQGTRLGRPPWNRKWDFNKEDCTEVLARAKNQLVCGISGHRIVPMPSVGYGPYYSTGGMVDDNGNLRVETQVGKPAKASEFEQYRKELAECHRMVEESRYPFHCLPYGSGAYAVHYHMGSTLEVQTKRPYIHRPGSTLPFPVGPAMVSSYSTLDDCLQHLHHR
jgi:hypothetical protein